MSGVEILIILIIAGFFLGAVVMGVARPWEQRDETPDPVGDDPGEELIDEATYGQEREDLSD